MDNKLENRSCPKCGNKLKAIMYGMVDSETADNPDVILGGCAVDGNEPFLGCSDCGFEGFPGGRTYRTFHTKPGYKPGTENSKSPEIITREFDLVSASTEELWGWSDGLFEARLELLHRGVSNQQIQDAYLENENWDFMPFDPFETILCYFSRLTGKVLGFGIFYAHAKFQAAHHLGQGDSRWNMLTSSTEFLEVLMKHESEGLETWKVDFDGMDSAEAYSEEMSTLGSEFLVSCLANNWALDPAGFPREMRQLDRPILWPFWFDRSLLGQI